LPVVLYVCETWSLALREKCRQRVFENRVLRRIFGPKRDEVIRELKENYTTRSLVILTKHYSGVQIKKNEISGVCSTYRGK